MPWLRLTDVEPEAAALAGPDDTVISAKATAAMSTIDRRSTPRRDAGPLGDGDLRPSMSCAPMAGRRLDDALNTKQTLGAPNRYAKQRHTSISVSGGRPSRQRRVDSRLRAARRALLSAASTAAPCKVRSRDSQPSTASARAREPAAWTPSCSIAPSNRRS